VWQLCVKGHGDIEMDLKRTGGKVNYFVLLVHNRPQYWVRVHRVTKSLFPHEPGIILNDISFLKWTLLQEFVILRLNMIRNSS